jgi:MFS family permease
VKPRATGAAVGVFAAPPLSMLLGGMIGLQIFTTMALNCPSVLGPVVLADFKLQPAQLGYFVTIILVTGMFSSLLGGPVIRALGAMRASQAGALVIAAGLALAATRVGWLMFVAALLLGAGIGPITPANSQILAKRTPPHRLGLAMALRQSGLPVGVGLMGVVFPALLLRTNWQGALLALAGVIALMALALQPMRNAVDAEPGAAPARAPAGRRPGLWRPLAQLWRDPGLRGVAVCVWCFSISQAALLLYAVSYFTVELHFSLVTAGALFALVQLAALPCRLLWGWAADRLGDPVLLMGVLALASAVFMALFGMAKPEWPMLAMELLFAFGGATACGWNGLYFAAIARQVPPAAVGSITGAMQMFTYLGGLTGPPICAALIGWTGRYSMAYLLVAVFMLLFGLWVALVLRRVRPAEPGLRKV